MEFDALKIADQIKTLRADLNALWHTVGQARRVRLAAFLHAGSILPAGRDEIAGISKIAMDEQRHCKGEIRKRHGVQLADLTPLTRGFFAVQTGD